jgi:hypothetical protein
MNDENVSWFELECVLNDVRSFFNDDKDKFELWMKTDNPMLGDVSPVFMIKLGKKRKLMNFIKDSLSENYKEEK